MIISVTHKYPELIHDYHLEKRGLLKFMGEKIYVISALELNETNDYHLDLINSSFVMLVKLNEPCYIVKFV